MTVMVVPRSAEGDKNSFDYNALMHTLKACHCAHKCGCCTGDGEMFRVLGVDLTMNSSVGRPETSTPHTKIDPISRSLAAVGLPSGKLK